MATRKASELVDTFVRPRAPRRGLALAGGGKMHKLFRVVVLGCGAALLACEDTPTATPLETPSATFDLFALEPTEEAILAEAGITVLQPNENDDAATGGVRYVLSKEGFPAQLAFSAIRRLSDDGKTETILGQYEYREEQKLGKLRVHGDVACLIVAKNSAVLGGPIKHMENETGLLIPEGWVVFTVVDNGEPNEAVGKLEPDLASRATFGVQPTPDPKDPKKPTGCAVTATPQPTEEGNIQVHDGGGL